MDLTTPSTDRCPNCGAQMAIDQRYCIVCGERRSGGGLRDALPRSPAAAPAPPSRKRAAMSPSTSLIAGVATLLLALGVGVLIGRAGDHGATAKSSTPQVVTVAASPAANTSGASTAATAAASTAAAKRASRRAKKRAAKSSSKVSGASSVEATAKKNGVKLPPKVVKIGQKCEKGAKGCQGGKFTGNFFGGG
jgi:hypothetical protein